MDNQGPVSRIGAFLFGSTGVILGLVFAGYFIGMAHPQTPLQHLAWGALAAFAGFSGMLGTGRFIDEPKLGLIGGTAAAITVVLVYLARVLGWLPLT